MRVRDISEITAKRSVVIFFNTKYKHCGVYTWPEKIILVYQIHFRKKGVCQRKQIPPIQWLSWFLEFSFSAKFWQTTGLEKNRNIYTSLLYKFKYYQKLNLNFCASMCQCITLHLHSLMYEVVSLNHFVCIKTVQNSSQESAQYFWRVTFLLLYI